MRSGKLENTHILIVDNHAFSRDNLRRSLQATGVHHVNIVSNANKAIAVCKQNDVDLIISEYDLGEGKNGQQLLEELRSQRWLKNTSGFVILTAETTRDVVLSTLEFKPDDYLAKPYLDPALLRRLRRVVRYKHALRAVYSAIDDNSLLAAIALCVEYLREGKDYREPVTMLLAELYMATDQYQQAQSIYDTALVKRDADWARAGLARVYMQQEKWQQAEDMFQSLIDINYMYVEAYEELARIYLRQEKNQKAEDILARATLVSPLSLRRQQLLASVAEKNNHFETAAKAWRQVLRVARYSKHETEENYLRLCSCLTDYCDFASAYKDEKVTNEISKSLLTMRKYYRPSIDSENQALLIEGRMFYGKGNIEKAKEIVDQIDQRYIEKADTFSVHTQLEFAKSLSQTGDTARAQRVLKKLVAQCDDKDVLQRADKVLDEPVSDLGKKRIIELNRSGINYFKNQQYELAVNAFAEAQSFFPRNIELNLNLVQALLKLVAVSEDEHAKERWLATAENCLQLIVHIPRDHKKYDNFRRLRAEVESLQSA